MKILNVFSILFIRLYKLILAPILPPACRLTPSCSEYAVLAFQEHNFFRALYYSIRRVLSCNPWNHKIYDPVPLKNEIKLHR